MFKQLQTILQQFRATVKLGNIKLPKKKAFATNSNNFQTKAQLMLRKFPQIKICVCSGNNRTNSILNNSQSKSGPKPQNYKTIQKILATST